MSSVIWDQVTECHLSDSWAPELSPTIYSLVRSIGCDLNSLATNSLQWLLVCFGYLFDGCEVTLTLQAILVEVLSSAVLEILQSDVMHVTTSAVNTGVADC